MKIKPNDIVKYLFILLIVLFLSLYISQSTGYYAYSNYEKKILTEEGIKKFEEDVASGVDIDINNYLEKNNDYSNKISDMSLKLSNTIGKYVKNGLVSVFKKLNKLIE